MASNFHNWSNVDKFKLDLGVISSWDIVCVKANNGGVYLLAKRGEKGCVSFLQRTAYWKEEKYCRAGARVGTKTK
jgi:hypothetical protein